MPSVRKKCDPERKKENNPKKSGPAFTLLRQRAAHALLSDQQLFENDVCKHHIYVLYFINLYQFLSYVVQIQICFPNVDLNKEYIEIQTRRVIVVHICFNVSHLQCNAMYASRSYFHSIQIYRTRIIREKLKIEINVN